MGLHGIPPVFKNFSEFNYCYIKKFAVPWRNINRLPYRRGNGKINSNVKISEDSVICPFLLNEKFIFHPIMIY